MTGPAALPAITQVQRFSYRPGDRFLVRVAGELYSPEQADEIARYFRRVLRLPADVPVCVIEEAVDVEIASPHSSEARKVFNGRCVC